MFVLFPLAVGGSGAGEEVTAVRELMKRKPYVEC